MSASQSLPKERRNHPKQVYNCDKNGLFCKKMSKKTFITHDEKGLAGHKPVKDRLTLLLC